MRKILIFVSLVLSALIFFSCAGDSASGQPDETTADVETTVEVTTAEETTAPPTTTAPPETEPETEPPKLTVVKSFTFTDPADIGWRAANQVKDLRAEDGLLILTSTGGDPFIESIQPLDIDATEIDVIRIKVLNTTESYNCQFFFSTDTESAMSEDKSYKYIYDFSFSDPDSDEWNIIEIYTDECIKWEGVIKKVRFDPTTIEGDVFIEYINFEKFED
jgi:hypothetical protein